MTPTPPAAAMIRSARPEDIDSILSLIRELAVYEKLEHDLDLSAGGLQRDLFGPAPACEALLAEVATPAMTDSNSGTRATTVGYALFFPTYSTFKTHRCLHLEDVYVTPRARGQGHGKALLAAVAAAARDRGCPRLDWNVLSWNQPAIDFYSELGASVLSDWWLCRLEGDSLVQVAELADKIP